MYVNGETKDQKAWNSTRSMTTTPRGSGAGYYLRGTTCPETKDNPEKNRVFAKGWLVNAVKQEAGGQVVLPVGRC